MKANSFRILIFLLLSVCSAVAQPVADFTANRTSDCVPAIIQFSSTSTGNPTSYSWDFGDASGTSILQNPSYTYATPGVYTVTLTVSGPGGSDTEIKTGYITVFRNPVASYTMSQDTACSGTNVTFISTSTPGDGAINQFQWTFNDGTPSVSGSGTVSHAFTIGSTSQSFFPILLINDVNGCNSSISDTIVVFPQPIAAFTINQQSACTAPATVSFTNASQFTGIYNWNFGDPASGSSNTSTLTNPSHVYNQTGTYTVVLTAGVNGCSATASNSVTVQQPVAAFSASDTVICQLDTIRFNSTGTTGSYSWNFDDPGSGSNNFSTLPNPEHIFLGTGTHQVRLIVTVGNCRDTVYKTITVRTPPTAVFSAPVRLACDTPLVVNFSDTASSHVAWSWNFGDPASGTLNTSFVRNPTHTYHSFGVYSVSLTVTDNFGCSGSLTSPNFVQIIAPTLDFTKPDSGCVGSTFTFNAIVNSPADPTITNYSWNFGDGTGVQNSTSPSITHQFNSVGIFTVSLTITTSTGCQRSLSKPAYIRIGNKPSANFSATPRTICFKENVLFTDLSGPAPITGWFWNFGDGGSSTSQNPSHQYNSDTSGTADPFDVTLIAFHNGCADTVIFPDYITVLGPLPNFAPVYNCSNPYSVDFTNLTGGATNYSWNFGDMSPVSTQFNPSHTYAGRGTYTVVLTASNTGNGCSVDTVRNIIITDPIADIVNSGNNVCHPATIQFTGSGSTDYVQQVWYFGEGIPGVNDTAFTINPSHIYNRPGTYTAKLIVTDIHGCTDTANQVMQIIGPTTGFFATPVTACAPMTVNFTDTSKTVGGAITQWVWNYGNGSETTTSGFATRPYPLPGTYSVTLTVTDVNNCTHSVTIPNYIRPTKPVPAISFADTVCRNVPVAMNASAGPFVAAPLTYEWNFGDNNSTTVNTAAVTHSYANNGLYVVKLKITDNNGCVDSTTRNIYVYTTPASFSTTLADTCVDRNGIKQAIVKAILVSDSNLYVTNYSWDLEVNAFSGPTRGTIEYDYDSPPGAYDVQLIVTNRFGCSDTLLKPGLVVVPGPIGSFTLSPDSGCRPLTVNFAGSASNAAFYAWDFGDGNVIPNTSDSILSHTYTYVGSFIPKFYLGFQLPSSGSFCYVPVPNADTVKVTSLVSINILEDTLIIRDGEIDTMHVQTIAPPGQNISYVWNPAAVVTADPVLANTYYAGTTGATQYYYVNAQYGNGCSGLDSILVIYITCEGQLNKDSIPNVFTPNNDGKNDLYYIKDLCNYDGFRFVIYNRWGKIIYETSDTKFRWDGTTNSGEEASEGTYYYLMHAKSKDFHGYIQLIRK